MLGSRHSFVADIDYDAGQRTLIDYGTASGPPNLTSVSAEAPVTRRDAIAFPTTARASTAGSQFDRAERHLTRPATHTHSRRRAANHLQEPTRATERDPPTAHFAADQRPVANTWGKPAEGRAQFLQRQVRVGILLSAGDGNAPTLFRAGV